MTLTISFGEDDDGTYELDEGTTENRTVNVYVEEGMLIIKRVVTDINGEALDISIDLTPELVALIGAAQAF